MRLLLSFLVTMLLSFGLRGQSSSEITTTNIIANPGFEAYAAPPIGWFYNGQHFTKVLKYWSSATAASPDAFGPRVRVPEHWAEKGFGNQQAHEGQCMVGITVFGCDEGKPHCREYVQIPLNEPLVIGQEYYAECWVGRLPLSLEVNNLGFYFSEEKISLPTDEPLYFEPQVNAGEIFKIPAGQWIKTSGEFTAKKEANYLIIGNFFPDSLTQMRRPCAEAFPYAYYYLDAVLVKKMEPILPVPIKEDDLTRIKIEAGRTITLKDIFFETDQAELLPRSYVELNKLLQIMRKHPNLVIRINGHTDIRGDDAHNQTLSERRAKAVVDFLIKRGIPADRSTYQGFGSSQPIAPNTDETGRQLNRRVEMEIVRN